MESSATLLSPEEVSQLTPADVLNVNIGIMGHVDSGKTSLCRILTQVASTAALDKHPESQERGITLDLGFSACFTTLPQAIAEVNPTKKALQLTLVDCPGHASLMKTIIGSSSIIDFLLLVIDVNKGIEIQTAECMILGEMLGLKLVVALNKIDMLGEDRDAKLAAKIAGLRKTFAKTKFAERQPHIPMIGVCATEGKVSGLVSSLVELCALQRIEDDLPFFCLVDHCFNVKGKGTVVTGTVLQGKLKKGEDVELPEIDFRNKVKGIQVFKKETLEVKRGDRCGLLINGLVAENLERGVVCKPGYLKKVNLLIVKLQKVRYWKHEIASKVKYSISIGHLTTMARLFLFKTQGQPPVIGSTYEYVDQIAEQEKESPADVYGVLFLDKVCYLREQSFFIGSRLELSIETKECRMAFCGEALFQKLLPPEADFEDIKLTKDKKKVGVVEWIANDGGLVLKDMFHKHSNIQSYINSPVTLDAFPDLKAKLTTTFGNAGKVKVFVSGSLTPEQISALPGTNVTLKYTKIIQSKV